MPAKHHPENLTAIPSNILNALKRRADSLELRRATKEVQEYDQVIQAQLVLTSWHHVLAGNNLPQMFESAQVNLAQEPEDACRDLADTFGEGARKRLLLAKRALCTVQDELEKPAPSLQMVKQALNYATCELRELNEVVKSDIEKACEQSRNDYRGEAMQPILTDSPMRAVEGLHSLMLAVEAQGPEILAVIEREQKKNRTPS